ncbi:MAG TPA: hypothetical protein VKR43_06420 [Bryobacteraceae bacterium]|nr:hypothetical protein [Bryobacteraceae bacterium]
MSDRLYLSLWIRNFDESTMLRHFEKMLGLFPFSKLAARGPVLRVYAIEYSEPPLFEREFIPGAEPREIVEAASEFMKDDCACELDAAWDLWQFDGDWKLAPAAVTLTCFAPVFDNDIADHLRIEFGLDSRYIPDPKIEGGLRMGQSNLKSLVHLVQDIEKRLDLDRRQLWSESGQSPADAIAEALIH